MSEVLDKEGPVALPLQLKDIMRKRIETGYYTSGRKIDSIRKIANEFNISSLTVQRALKLLETDDYVTSIPASGIFVNEKFWQEKKTIKIVLVFPEVAISRDILDPEVWGLNSELYRGLISGAQKYGAQVGFVHVDEDLKPLQMLRQIKRLKQQYDAAVFIGPQLLELQLKLAKEIQVFQYCDEAGKYPGIIEIFYDHNRAVETLVRHVCECSCRTAGVISYFEDLHEKDVIAGFRRRTAKFLNYCEQYGIEAKTDWEFDDTTKGELVEKLTDNPPDFIFCNQTYFVNDLYEKCAENNIRIGQDVMVAAIASGVTFMGLIPAMTYVRVPMFEVAQSIVKKACKIIRDGISVSELDHLLIEAPLIRGKSTSKKHTVPIKYNNLKRRKIISEKIKQS